MATIECKLGSAEVNAGGSTYSFQRDPYGRFTARVDRADDIKMFLAVEHYREVPAVPPEHVEPADFIEPGFGLGLDDDDDTSHDHLDDDDKDHEYLDGDDAPDLGFKPPETIPPAVPGAVVLPIADDLTKIVGIGPKVAEKLAVVGIVSFSQIMDLTPEKIDELDKQLKLFGSIVSKDWIGQAKALLVPQL
ncbi:hypothetical protein [Mesorhizobium huakuii]|uniref:Helix-hairpin-helix domain-containing protein n=1 Tax=Mesorhizobium huakuii TaxID=28104 RepID=A0A7G6T0U6_9HYPH|nr:hypothetical protein [Mesorhizobium huakuii]QND60378.1 hypothetical protein HB778_30400 [Mesorhizobium huakuii]